MAADEKETRREMLSKAWDEVEEKDEVEPHAQKTEDESISSEVPEEGVRHADPKVSEKEKDPLKEEAKKPDATDTQKREEQAARDSVAKPAPVTDRAPNSWKPAIREHWAKLPPEVRAEVSRRELEVQQSLSQTAQVRKFAQDFAQTIHPYSHLIRAQNSTPLQAVSNLMQTAAGLTQGNQQQKAAIVADIINNYGIDIVTLDAVLTQKHNPQSQPQVQAPPAWAKPIFGFMDNVQKMQEQRQQQLQQEADQAIQALEQKPFFDDVREDMADLMEAAANRGRVLSMEQAYERAITLNPDLKKIVDQRALAATNRNPVSEAAATLARARKASSTVKGAPSGPKSGVGGKLTRRQQLAEAWDDSAS